MSDNQSSNKRIAKNAIALYLRMMLSMLVGLYTSRVILQALGVEDYGIYNVVGGFVSMFSLISKSISGSVSRFLTFELGRGDVAKLKRVFSTSILVLCGISILVVIATESIGLWYLYNKMVIPTERMDAAFGVFQISVLTFVISLINMPYEASIVSHERMDIYAYFSISDAIIKLLICYAVMVSPIDRLVFYALLLFIAGTINQIIYVWFCKKKFEECTFNLVLDKNLFKEMFGFAGWNFIGSSAALIRSQGGSLLINWVGGPVVNAANGIANTVSGVVSGFVDNFTQAFNPQITKRYAAGEYESLMTLLVYGSKFSFYLMFIIALPVALNAEFLLKTWLGVVPEHSVAFVRLTLLFLLTDTIIRPTVTVKNATGNIRNYQLVVGCVVLLTIPLAYIGLKMGMPVEIVATSSIFTSIIAIGVRLYMMRNAFPLWSSWVFFHRVVLNAFFVVIFASIIPLVVYYNQSTGWMNFISTSVVSLLSTIIVILYIGCNNSERHFLFTKSKQVFSTLRSRLRL